MSVHAGWSRERARCGWRARTAGALALAIVALLATALTVSAHANVERAQPAPDVALPQSPDRVTIRFTEPVAPALSAIEVLDATGARIDRDDSAVDGTDAHVMTVSLPPLVDGTYTVFWRNVSTVDGHARRGTYVFYVGEKPAGAPASSVESQPLFASPLDPIARWLVLAGGLVAAGGLAFHLAVARPAERDAAGDRDGHGRQRAESAVAEALAATETHARRLVVGGLAVFLAGSLVHVVVQATSAGDASVIEALGTPLRSVVTDTRWGRMWLIRVVLGVIAAGAVAAWWRRPPSAATARAAARAETAVPLIALGLLAAALATLSFASHGAVTPGVAAGAVMSDALHLLAAATWAGGLPAMALAVTAARGVADETARRALLRALASRFSALGVLGTGALLVTGLYGAWAQLVTADALSTPYGRLVLAKVALLAGLVVLGAVNQRRLAPRLGRGRGASRWLGRVVRVEIALAALAVLAAAMLTAIEPGRQTAAREAAAEGIRFAQTVETTRIDVAVRPGAIGTNDVVVELADARGRPVADATHVGVRIQFVGADLGAVELVAAHEADGRYVARDVQVSVAGRWQIEVAVSRPDALDARTAFRFDVGLASAGGGAAFEPSVTAGNLAWAWEVILLGGLLLVVANTWWSRDRVFRGVNVLGAGAVVVGIVMWFGLPHTHEGAPATAGGPVNPYTPDTASIAAGREVFQSVCATCHGMQGRGDGPEAAALNPPPADLTLHVPLHSDGELFGMIAAGVPRTAMAGFRGRLTDEQMWHLVNFLRTLEDASAADGSAPPAATPAGTAP